ncbi:MAG: hypothetical protein ACRDKF_01730 [Actinomycetota bacterium]
MDESTAPDFHGHLLALSRKVINDSPFAWEGHRKVTARLRREHGVHVGRNNDEWLIERHGHCIPREAYASAIASQAA